MNGGGEGVTNVEEGNGDKEKVAWVQGRRRRRRGVRRIETRIELKEKLIKK